MQTTQSPKAGERTQPEFLIKTDKRWNRGRICQRAELVARFHEKNRPCKKQPLRGIATMVEGTGKFDKTYAAVCATGTYSEPVRMTQDDVKAKVRRIRPEEAAELNNCDDEIARYESAITNLRTMREELLARAFTKGHCVYLNEIREAAESRLPAPKI